VGNVGNRYTPMPDPFDLPAGNEMINGLTRHPRTQGVGSREEPVLTRC